MTITFKATSRAADAPNVEPDVYDATFDSVRTKYMEGGQYGDGDRFEWSFALLDEDGAALYDDGDPLVVTGLTSLSTNTKSKTVPKAVRFLKAIMTADEYADFEAEKGVDAAALIGRRVQVEVAISDSGWPKVVNVLPARRKRSRVTTEE